jgi:hypothetical protein
MELISRNKANEIATYQISKENAIDQAIEYVNRLITKESNKGNFKTSVLCSQFKCNDEIRKDVCDFVIYELGLSGYKVKLKHYDEFSEDCIEISWE